MKILLIGDFSGVHLNLRQGLRELGHEVLLVSKGDGFKSLPADIRLFVRRKGSPGLTGALREIASQVATLKHLRGFDVIQTASHQFFHNRINSFLFPMMLKGNRASVLLNTACTFPFRNFVKELPYSPCAGCEHFDLGAGGCQHADKKQVETEKKIYSYFNGIVSTHFEYFDSFCSAGYVTNNRLILLPVVLKEHPFSVPDSNKEKLVVYYGEIRKGYKGGTFIEKALDMLEQSEYGKYFEVIRTSRIPYKDYLEVMNKADVVIDQASSHSYGMNALFSLARGKIVLSGAESSALKAMNVSMEENPIINIRPDPVDILKNLTRLYDERNDLTRRAVLGREFVEKHHDHMKIARQYEQYYFDLIR